MTTKQDHITATMGHWHVGEHVGQKINKPLTFVKTMEYSLVLLLCKHSSLISISQIHFNYHHYHTINIVIYQHTEDPAYVSSLTNCLTEKLELLSFLLGYF